MCMLNQIYYIELLNGALVLTKTNERFYNWVQAFNRYNNIFILYLGRANWSNTASPTNNALNFEAKKIPSPTGPLG